MQIALVVPSYFPRVTGNAVSAKRIITGLCAAGHEARIVDAEALGPYVPAVLAAYEPEVVHAFHARRSGFLVRDHRPLVISITGTDAERDLLNEGKRAEVLAACRAAQALVVHHSATAAPLVEADPSLSAKIRVVTKGVGLIEEAPFALRALLGLPADRPLFLLPGGLRPVKGQLRAIRALEGLDVSLVLAGPALDGEYAAAVAGEARSRPWVRVIDIKPHARMAGAYRDADVVLNCSDSEGMSNAILEAMFLGRPVIASDIPGNRALVSPGVSGLLFGNEDDLREQARTLRDDPVLRATLGQAAAARVRAAHSTEAEIKALLDIYGDVIAATRA